LETFFPIFVSGVQKDYTFAPMEEKKMEILQKTALVYMRYGIRSVTMDDLARELGMSKKTLYQYFPDKDSLVQEIMHLKVAMDQQLNEMARQHASNAIDEMFEISQSVADLIRNVHPSVFYDLQKYHPKAWAIMENHKWNYVYNQILSNIKRGMTEGLYRDNMNPELIARMHLAKTDMIFAGNLFPPNEFNLEEVFTELFRFQIRGMASEKGIEYLKKRMNIQNNEN
jgi:TetR/AcrR family transcriptional regulator, cholesterol catabolism regulator